MANIELDGANKKIKVDSGDLTLDIPGDIILDADGANVTFKDGGTSVLDLSNSSTDAVLTVSTQDKDLIIKGDDGGSAITAATFDMSDAGTLILNHDLVVADAGKVGSASATDAMTISSGGIVTFKDDILIKDGGTIGSASDADAIAIAANGVVTFSQNPVFPDGGVAVADLDIDGATDIGADIVDADLFIIDDGAGGTNRKTAASRLKTYIGGAGLTYLSKHTASDGDSYLTLDGVFDSSYDNYLLIGTLWQNNTDNNHLRIQFKTTAFSADSIYDSQVMGINGGSVGGTINQNNSAYGTMGGLGNQGSASNEHSNFQLTIYQPADQNQHQFWQTHTSGKMYDGNYIAGSGGGVWEDLTAVTGIRFYYGSGTIKSGEVLLYGIKSS